jgi:hypothetical protein
VHAVVGGTGSVLGGGKFGNGAMTGAFSYLFNALSEPGRREQPEDLRVGNQAHKWIYEVLQVAYGPENVQYDVLLPSGRRVDFIILDKFVLELGKFTYSAGYDAYNYSLKESQVGGYLSELNRIAGSQKYVLGDWKAISSVIPSSAWMLPGGGYPDLVGVRYFGDSRGRSTGLFFYEPIKKGKPN